MANPIISICIPSYQRSKELGELLESISSQYDPLIHEVLIIDDCSPNFHAIQEVVNSKNLSNIRLLRNPKNFGYDKNLRELIRKASGDFVLFMGNDDLFEEGAIEYYTTIIRTYGDDLGFVVRSYREFDNLTGEILKTIRYVDSDEILHPSEKGAGFVFRRSVAIMGMMYNRRMALELDCEHFDGSIYYQLWLSGNISLRHKVFISARPTTLRRCGLPPDFGVAAVEKDSIGEGFFTQDAFVKFVEKMLLIAKEVSISNDADIFYRYVQSDFSRYSLPFMTPLRAHGLRYFFNYYVKLCRLGLGRTIYFHLYFISLSVLGVGRVEKFVAKIRKYTGTSSVIAVKYK